SGLYGQAANTSAGSPNISSATGGLIFNNPINTFRAQGRYTNTYNLADNASWVHQKHNISFGFQFQHEATEPYNDVGITPTYTLGMSSANPNTLQVSQLPGASTTDVASANNLLANLAGYVSAYTQTFNAASKSSGFVSGATNDRHWNLNNYSFYVQ